jgi:hypothetical protein
MMRRDLPIRRPGGQVRRQPIRRASPRLRSTQIYALILMFLCVLAVVTLGNSPVFKARNLEVHGATFTREDTVSHIVGMSYTPNLFRLRTDRVATELVALPAVESARVDVRLPDTVVVTLVERQPRLIWVVGDRRYVVDDTGFLFGQVDSAGNPIEPTAVPTPTPTPSAPEGSPSPDDSGSAASPDGSAGNATATPSGDAVSNRRDASAAKVTPRPTVKPKATPKPTPKATPRPTPKPTLAPSPTVPAPSIEPIPMPDPAATAGPHVVNLPIVYDRRAQDAGLGLGDVVDPIALDAGYRLAGLTPRDIGSLSVSLDVVLDDDHGFTLSSGANGWVAQFGFYTETLRKDTVIPEQVRDLRSALQQWGEDHVAWVFLVADIAGNHIDTYIPR